MSSTLDLSPRNVNGADTRLIPPRRWAETGGVPPETNGSEERFRTGRRKTMRQIKTQAAALAALAALGVLASCSNDDSQAQTEPSPTGDGAATDTTPDPGYTIVAQDHLYGPGRWAMRAAGDPEAPLAVFDVPGGFQGGESFVWASVDTLANLTYSTPTRVYADPCDSERPSPRVGPAVEDLASALATQRRSTTTEPVPTQLGGYRGLYLELTLSRADSDACNPKPKDGMLIWETAVRGDGRVLDPPATDRYWILDLDGRRVVVTAMTEAGTSEKTVERVTDVAESVIFVEATP
jgi:hypothetical protein